MPTVWICNEAGHDYSDAKRYGEPKPLTIGNVNPLQVDRLKWHLARGIAKYASADDYLLISGTPMVNAIALAIWLNHFRAVKLLQWNAKHRVYELSEFTLDHLMDLIEKELVR